MGLIRVIGIMLAVAGAVLFWSGYQATRSLAEIATQKLTGRYSERTTLYLAAGAAGVVGGGLLTIFGGGGRRRR